MIKIGDKIDDRYKIVSRIATGGMADVYEANDLIGKKIVSLKIMKESLMDEPNNAIRFHNEAMAAASLSHPNIVRVLGVGDVNGRPFMVNEYIQGQTLRDKLNFTQSLSLGETCDVMLQLTAGISYIHKHGLVHRDIKPDNLFYLPSGELKIGDFGISTPIGTKPVGDSIQGTIYYCSPEVLMGKPAERSNDIYSMGVVFFEMLTGRIPFDGKCAEDIANRIVRSRFPEASKFMSSLPKSIDKLIAEACRKNPSERFASADEFHDAIVNFMNDKDQFKERKGLLQRLFGFK